MAVILALGSNQGNTFQYLKKAIFLIHEVCAIEEISSVYHSEPMENTDQNSFHNLCLQATPPDLSPDEFMLKMLAIEKKLGRIRDTDKGPRTIDIDLVFWDLQQRKSTVLTLPHPRWQLRSFVVQPLAELTYFQTIKQHFSIPTLFETPSCPLEHKLLDKNEFDLLINGK